MELSSAFKKLATGTVWISIGLLGLNLLLKFYFIDLMRLGHDEPYTVDHASLPGPGSIIESVSRSKNPPGFEILLHYWMKLFGDSLFALRALPVLLSSLTVLFVYRIGKDFFSKNVGLIIAVIFTFSTLHIHHSHNIRVYALYLLLGCISMYAFFRCIRKPSRNGSLALMSLINGIGLYFHFFTVFVIILQGISVLALRGVRTSMLKRYFLSGILSFTLFAPYLFILLRRFSETYQKEAYIASSPEIQAFYNMLVKFSNSPFSALAFLAMILFACGLFLYQKGSGKNEKAPIKDERKVLLIWFPGLYILFFLISQITPIFIARYMLFVSIGFYLLIGLATEYLMRAPILRGRSTRFLIPGFIFLFTILTCQPNRDFYSGRGDRRTLLEHLFLVDKERKAISSGKTRSKFYLSCDLSSLNDSDALSNSEKERYAASKKIRLPPAPGHTHSEPGVEVLLHQLDAGRSR